MPELKIKIGAEDKELKQKLAQSKNRIGKFAKDMKAALGTVFGTASSLFTVAFITRSFGGLIDKMDQIGKSARALGVTAEGYQKIAYAARRANMPQDRLNMSFQRMANFLQASSQEASKQADMLGRLGLSYGGLIKMKPDAQFIAIGKAIDGVANATERLSLANKIYGRGARDVLNMVRGYEGMAQELKSRGGIISDEDIQSAEEHKDQVETLKSRIQATSSKFGTVQYWGKAVEGINEYGDRVQKMISKGWFDFDRSPLEGWVFGKGSIVAKPFSSWESEEIKKRHGAATSPEQRDAWRKRREEEAAGPPDSGDSLGKMLGGRLGKPSADAMHQIGGYLTPGQFESGANADSITAYLSSIDEQLKDLSRFVSQDGTPMRPRMDTLVEGAAPAL